LRRILPQHAAAGAALHLVLRAAGAAAEFLGAVDEADAPRAVLYRRDRDRTVHVRARGCTNRRRHQLAAARPEAGRDRAGVDHRADLSLRAAADGVPYHD